MANVAFKLGSQAALNSIASNKTSQEGSFYLTSDSHRLYIGLAGGLVASVNEGVINVPNIAQLPTITSNNDLSAGQFYYAQTENVLCVYNGSSWVQINPDTGVNSVEITASAASNVATVVTAVKDTKSSIFSDEFQIKGISGNQITVVPANGIVPPQVIISGDVYKISTTTTPENPTAPGYNTAEVKLSSTNQPTVDTKIVINGGDNVHVKGDSTTGQIEISSDNTTIDKVEFLPKTEGGFLLKITDSDEVPHEGTIDPVIKIGSGAGGVSTEEVHFGGTGSATLNVYTTSQVDTKIAESLKAMDALVFKGTVGTGGQLPTLPTTNVAIGDLYKIVSEGTYAGQYCKIGDMMIAQGTEDPATSVITGPITWVYVPSGAGSDTTYIGRKIVHGMTVVEAGNEGHIISSLSLSTDETNPIQLTDDATADATARSIKVTHKTKSQANTTGTAKTQEELGSLVIPVETKSVDTFGHVTGTVTTNYTVVDTHNNLNELKTTVGVAANAATVTVMASMTDGESRQSAFTVTSDNLVITEKVNENVNINFVWGSF